MKRRCRILGGSVASRELCRMIHAEDFCRSQEKCRMKWRVIALGLCLCGARSTRAQVQPAILPDAPQAQRGIIVGTVVDVNNDPVPGASVALQGATLHSPHAVVANNNGFFEFT